MNSIRTRCLALPLSLFLAAPHAYSASSLDVQFSGELISTTCKIDSESLNQEITLENLNWRSINQQGSSYLTPFSIGIDNCSNTDLNKSIKLTWQSNQLVELSGVNFVKTQGTSGVLLGIVDQNNQPIVWNSPTSVATVSVANDVQHINFSAFVRKPATGEADIGDFTSTVTFAVEYQ
ncbi:type 1 fimbrial protein [Acinetobacter sp. S40]|uniref:fimbrial protein n=1 Tax=Acinetobacter sp. S40 TaxID=2767434 RepID=UPI00190CEAED|nr:fimbrial protein [Acinetobacter sp. S40]MBJ9983886.1 type 1 fimbrial protein [Acinetobacter sp. S40]